MGSTLKLLVLFVAPAAWAWPDLQVVKTGPAQAAPGDVLTYTLRYTNAGPQKSTGVVLKDFLPNYVSVLTNTVNNSGTVSNTTVSWSLGTVYSHAGGTRSFQVRVNTNAFAGLSLTNRAQVLGKEAEESGKTSNNYSSWVTRITNGAPVAQNDLYAVTENTTLTIPAPGILANDSDPDGHALTAALVSHPTHGTLTLNSNGSFTYQPEADYVGNDSFTYRANDGQFDSGVATVTLIVLPCYPAVDVMLVIDRSGSMEGQPYHDARIACSNFVQNLHLVANADQAGLASYNSSATLDQKLTNNLQVLKQAIGSIPGANGYTSITLGLQTAQNELLSSRHNPLALPVLLLLSDGLPTGSDSPSNALYAASLAKNAGTRIFTVGLGDVDHSLMSGIASYPGDYFYTTNSSNLTALFNAISTVICRPPTNIFTVGPSNLTLCPGMTANFSVQASGCDAFTYQWTKAGVPLAGQTNSSLVIPNVAAGDSGTYAAEVHSNCKSVTNSATLTVNSNVTASGPFSQTNCVAGNVTFGTTAGGNGPYTYQWLRNGSVLAGQTDASLNFTINSTNDAGNYSVVVSGACGLPVTNNASLVVTPLPVIYGVTNRTVVAGTPWSFDTPIANYSFVIVSTTTNAVCSDNYTATRVWRATDPCGNIAQTTQTISIVDRTPPSITCPTNLVLAANDGTCARSNVTFTVIAADNCGVTNLTSVPPSGSTFPVGITTVTSTATDASGNQSSCTFTVTVNDTQLPTITCPALVNVIANNGQCSATNVVLGTPTVNDNCGVASITNNAPAIFPVGTNFVTWTVKDNSGNTANCLQTVIVRDTQLPTITCPALVNVIANNGQCSATNVVLGMPTVNDNCGVASITNDAPAIFPVGTNFVTWTVRDHSGNTQTCIQTVIVRDTQLPTITCPALVNVVANNGRCSATNVVLGMPTVNDNCGVASITNDAPAIFPVGTNFVTWTVKDNSGNTQTCVQSVIVRDTQLPTITCPALVNVIANNGQCSATNVALGTPTVNDNCGVASVTNNAPTIFPVGTNFVTWTVKDNSGNTANCIQTVIVQDAQPPVITCPPLANRIFEVGVSWTFDEVAATDNCGTPTLAAMTVTNLGCGKSYTATRTWRATDSSGNTAECTQTVSVVDTTAPTVSITSPTNGQVFIAPASFTVLANAQDSNGTIATVEFFAGTNKFGVTTNGAPHFAVTNGVPPGNYTLTARATDTCGNASTSAPVNILVIERPPLTILSALRYNPQTDFFEVRVRVTNPTYSTLDAIRVRVYNLTNTPPITVHNPSGFTNGVPYVQSHAAVAPESYVDMTIEFFSPQRIQPNPVLQAELVPPATGGSSSFFGMPQHINRGLWLANKTFLVEFATMSNRVYAIQYSQDLSHWASAQPAITGTGNWVQWIDNGQPKTESAPATQPARFYRLIVLP